MSNEKEKENKPENTQVKRTPPNPVTLKERLKFIESIEDIPAMPGVILNVVSKLDNPRVNFREVERLISTDPALVSYVLRVVNSPFLGLRTEILTIEKAIAVVGITNLRSLLIAYGIRFLYKTISRTDIQKYLWEHAITVGVISKILSEEIFQVVHAEAYVFGLLHDIGKIILLMYQPEKFNESLASQLDRHVEEVDIECEMFGFSHIEAGYYLLTRLGFPKKMKDIVLFHHNPEFCGTDNQLVWIISLANRLSYQFEELDPEDLAPYMEKLELPRNTIEKVVLKSQEELQEYLAFL